MLSSSLRRTSLLLLVLLLCCAPLQAVVVICPGTDPADECYCQQNEEGVTCPEGFYCPQYAPEVIAANMDAIEAENCTIRSSDGELQCPCTPGFYCPNNTMSPSYCCESYYCETPWQISLCPKGEFCKVGNVAGIPCGSERDCPEGSSESGNSGVVIAAVVIFLVLFIAFSIKYFIEAKVREAQRGAVIREKELSEVAEERLTVVEALNEVNDPKRSVSSDKALSIGDPNEVVEEKEGSETYKIEFEGVGLVLKSGVKIMNNVSGEFLPRRVCAIMGPSGAGKTTIINLVTGKAKKTEGIIRVNGAEVDDLSKWKKLVGFVPQEDVMIRQLTVRDNITFSASYRLPASMSYSETQHVVNETLLSLGIDHVQHSIIGDERERGVSGGQRKRVNIGIELAALPRVLFLDEPTSGLDSTSSFTLTKQLKEIAVQQNVTIAAVIHQPSMATFNEFDDLLLLGKGGMVVYQGPVSAATEYFESIGFVMKGNMNPADFYLDIANGAVERENDPSFTPPDLFRFWSNKINGRPIEYCPGDGSDSPFHEDDSSKSNDEDSNTSGGTRHRTTTMVGSPEYNANYDATLNPLGSCRNFCVFVRGFLEFMWDLIVAWAYGVYEVIMTAFNNCTKKDEVRVTPGFWWQLALCMKRAFKQKYRNYGAIATQMMIHMGVAIVVGAVSTELQYVGPLPGVICATVTRDLYTPCTDPLSDSYTGTANFLSLGCIFAAISVSAGTFGNEQVNYWRESAAGLRTVPYFIAKWIIEFPNIVLASCFFWLAFQIRFPNTNSSNTLFVFFFSVYWWSWSLGFLLSSLAPPDKVFLLGVLAAILLAVGFSGTNPTIDEVNDMSPAVSWLWSCSGTRWMLEAFYVSQVEYYETVPSGPLEGEPYMNVEAGLNTYGYKIDNFDRSLRGLWWCGVGYGLAAMVIMITSNRDKKK